MGFGGQGRTGSVILNGYAKGSDINLTVNEWHKAERLGNTHWLCVMSDPLGPSHQLLPIRTPAVKLAHAKCEVLAARYYDIPAEAVIRPAKT